jgi:hypothetical protein
MFSAMNSVQTNKVLLVRSWDQVFRLRPTHHLCRRWRMFVLRRLEGGDRPQTSGIRILLSKFLKNKTEFSRELRAVFFYLWLNSNVYNKQDSAMNYTVYNK